MNNPATKEQHQTHPRAQLTGLVPKLVVRTHRVVGRYAKQLDSHETMLSGNKVTGFSVNFPIAETCSPTKVCASTCYFARDATTWPDPLRKQYRIYNTVKADPIAAAERLATEVTRRFQRKQISFIRWNGGGDLFPESVTCLNHFAELCPFIPTWVVTRLPDLAALLAPLPNIFIHFSLDRSSMDRRDAFEKINKRSANYFYSYQCDRGEHPSAEQLRGVSVLFYHCYELPPQLPRVAKEVICPLNTESDIAGVCEWCRRCFNGNAVKHSRKQRRSPSRAKQRKATDRRG